MEIRTGTEFDFEGLNWVVTTVILGIEGRILGFRAKAFNGNYYEFRDFNISQQQQAA